MSDINKWIGVGRLTKDPELKVIPSGASVCSFSIASNYKYVKDGDKKEIVSFFNCTAWGKTGETIAEYVKKGHRIGLDGRLQQESWEDQDGNKRQAVKIIVDSFQFLQAKGGSDAPAGSTSTPAADNPFIDEDIPF